jgi:hypothetical protein
MEENMKNKKIIIGLIFISFVFITGCSQVKNSGSGLSLQELCKQDGNHFMTMMPIIDGDPTGDTACAGCMIGANHYCDLEAYKKAKG